jgi:orotidine-5'-phosphate decarboxylase
MMRETADRCRQMAQKLNRPKPILLAVTILTSLDEKNLQEVGLQGPVGDRVVALADLARQSGIDGVVASPQEISAIRRKCGPEFVIVTPGIRPAFVEAGKDDQKRVLTAKEAVSAGADYIVVGRPIRLASDPAAAMDKVIAEIA